MSINETLCLSLTTLCLSLGCATEPYTNVIVPESTEDGTRLAQKVEGVWTSQSEQMSTCPADLSLHPFHGEADWRVEGSVVNVIPRNSAAHPLRFYSVDRESMRHQLELRYEDCVASEVRELRVLELTDERLSARYSLRIDWTAAPHCNRWMREHSGGLDAPCESLVLFDAFRLSKPLNIARHSDGRL